MMHISRSEFLFTGFGCTLKTDHTQNAVGDLIMSQTLCYYKYLQSDVKLGRVLLESTVSTATSLG